MSGKKDSRKPLLTKRKFKRDSLICSFINFIAEAEKVANIIYTTLLLLCQSLNFYFDLRIFV